MSLAPFVDPSSSQTRKRGHRELMELTLTRIFDDVTPLEQCLAKFVEFICFADSWESGVVWLTGDDGLLTPVAGTSDGKLAARAHAEGEVISMPGVGAAFLISDSRQTIGVIELFNHSMPPLNEETTANAARYLGIEEPSDELVKLALELAPTVSDAMLNKRPALQVVK